MIKKRSFLEVVSMVPSSELKRKIVHLGNGAWIFVLAFIPRWLAILAVLVALIAVLSMNPRMWKAAFESMAREIDHRYGILIGPLIYVIVVLILVLFFDLRVAGAAFAMMAFGDGMAGLVGSLKGRHVLFRKKTVEGSLAFLIGGFIMSTLSLFIIDRFNPNPTPLLFRELFFITLPSSLLDTLLFMLGITLISSVLELLVGELVDDNAGVPLFVAVMLTIFW